MDGEPILDLAAVLDWNELKRVMVSNHAPNYGQPRRNSKISLHTLSAYMDPPTAVDLLVNFAPIRRPSETQKTPP